MPLILNLLKDENGRPLLFETHFSIAETGGRLSEVQFKTYLNQINILTTEIVNDYYPNTKKWLWLSRLWVIFLLVGFLAGYFILQVPLNSSTGTGQTSKGNSNNSNSADSSGGNGISLNVIVGAVLIILGALAGILYRRKLVDKWSKRQERYYSTMYKVLNTHINNISNDLVVAVGLNWSFIEEIDVVEDMALICSSRPAFRNWKNYAILIESVRLPMSPLELPIRSSVVMPDGSTRMSRVAHMQENDQDSGGNLQHTTSAASGPSSNSTNPYIPGPNQAIGNYIAPRSHETTTAGNSPSNNNTNNNNPSGPSFVPSLPPPPPVLTSGIIIDPSVPPILQISSELPIRPIREMNSTETLPDYFTSEGIYSQISEAPIYTSHRDLRDDGPGGAGDMAAQQITPPPPPQQQQQQQQQQTLTDAQQQEQQDGVRWHTTAGDEIHQNRQDQVQQVEEHQRNDHIVQISQQEITAHSPPAFSNNRESVASSANEINPNNNTGSIDSFRSAIRD